ncbi:hypothetical protein [Hungatella hathewayi]|uniref:hypothetical protein n=1 Tax=Hungatella hathewayi TaxID=154046 RepID=UPI003564CBC1
MGIDEKRVFELLEIYHGISSQYYEIPDSAEFLKIVKQELSLGKPILVDFDSFYSPWAPNFEKKTDL